MNDDSQSRAERQLKGMLARVFSDGIVTDEERSELLTALGDDTLQPERVARVVEDFIARSFSHFVADGKLTDSETSKARLIVHELGLREEQLPEALQFLARERETESD